MYNRNVEFVEQNVWICYDLARVKFWNLIENRLPIPDYTVLIK